MAAGGIRYQGMRDLATEIEDYREKMLAIFNKILDERIPAVSGVYAGLAADAFKMKLTGVINEFDQEIKKIIKQINDEVDIQSKDYQAQDQSTVI